MPLSYCLVVHFLCNVRSRLHSGRHVLACHASERPGGGRGELLNLPLELCEADLEVPEHECVVLECAKVVDGIKGLCANICAGKRDAQRDCRKNEGEDDLGVLPGLPLVRSTVGQVVRPVLLLRLVQEGHLHVQVRGEEAHRQQGRNHESLNEVLVSGEGAEEAEDGRDGHHNARCDGSDDHRLLSTLQLEGPHPDDDDAKAEFKDGEVEQHDAVLRHLLHLNPHTVLHEVAVLDFVPVVRLGQEQVPHAHVPSLLVLIFEWKHTGCFLVRHLVLLRCFLEQPGHLDRLTTPLGGLPPRQQVLGHLDVVLGLFVLLLSHIQPAEGWELFNSLHVFDEVAALEGALILHQEGVLCLGPNPEGVGLAVRKVVVPVRRPQDDLHLGVALGCEDDALAPDEFLGELHPRRVGEVQLRDLLVDVRQVLPLTLLAEGVHHLLPRRRQRGPADQNDLLSRHVISKWGIGSVRHVSRQGV
eukprot:Sspe_Gene.2239::Locus_745_Transcript_1_1_Confidence_1.000_Length_1538::g.2239::m.2239